MAKSKKVILQKIEEGLAELRVVFGELGIDPKDFEIPKTTTIPTLEELLAWVKRIHTTNEYRLFEEFGKYFDYSSMPLMRALGNSDLREYRDASTRLRNLARIMNVSGRPMLFRGGK